MHLQQLYRYQFQAMEITYRIFLLYHPTVKLCHRFYLPHFLLFYIIVSYERGVCICMWFVTVCHILHSCIKNKQFWGLVTKKLIDFCFRFFSCLSHYVAQADLKFTILLPSLPECWDYKCADYTQPSLLILNFKKKILKADWFYEFEATQCCVMRPCLLKKKKWRRENSQRYIQSLNLWSILP